MSLPAIPADTIERQRRASGPQSSAWVSANAGSGKTHVLTQRVVRLLLEGVPPARILCLTFTKAAAANMSIRVFDLLAAWTRLDDAALTQAIEATGAPRPSGTDLAEARRLFARTIETPGGLKIQTIHAFCERLLHLFPFEANVAARFEVIEDLLRQELLERARLDTLAEAMGDETSPLAQAVALLAADASASGFETLVGEALGRRDVIAAALEFHGTTDALDRALAGALGLDPSDTTSALAQDLLEGGLRPAEWAATARALGAGGSGGSATGNRLAAAALASPEAKPAAYLDVFLTKALAPRQDSYLVQALRKAQPDLCARLDAERARVHAWLGRQRAAETRERTLALVVVAREILARYEAAKRRRGLLDFDDLIERTHTLLARAGSAWVLYKLDAGIDHILVDEAQDTSPRQWDVLRAITADFFTGAGQSRRVRTFFAVGDEKQSIFSFQGAKPAKFDEMRQAFETDVGRAAGRFESVPLNLSFRSTAAILDTVDKVFTIPANAQGLTTPGNAPMPHVALRKGVPGLVQIWPLIGLQGSAAPDDWRLPLDNVDPASPAALLAARVAESIAAMVAPGSRDTVEDRAERRRRVIRPGDIMILVRQRTNLFEALIRALKHKGVPVAGADRMQLTEHIAVMDLLAAGRTALLPDDDLTLACVLKSPLIGLDDDDLIALAPGRRGSLHAALAASDEVRHRHAVERIAVWRQRSARLTPFGFYTRLLGADGGRKAMLERLGPEAADALDEFLSLTLSHEREGPPSLMGFLSRLEGESLSVKRDMEAAGDAVRVMTVHAAKGLEAKIVFLPDTCGAPSGRHDPRLFVLEPDGPGRPAHLAWSPRKDADPPPVAAARTALRQAAIEEHNRLLYVALTRAEERLYVGGAHGPRGKADGCWYDMILAGNADLAEVPAPWDPNETIRERRDAGLDAVSAEVPDPVPTPTPLPPWLFTTPAAEIVYAPPLKPSNPLGAADQQPQEPEGFGSIDRSDARRNAAIAGRLAHTLFQHLPALPPERRSAAAERLAAMHGGNLPAEQRNKTIADVLTAIADEAASILFGPDSRAEVRIAGRATLSDGREVAITGQIDRIAVTDHAILIADFKTGRPHDLDSVPTAYVAQLALYRAATAPLFPEKPVRAYLLWTAGPRLLEVPPETLDAALTALTVS